MEIFTLLQSIEDLLEQSKSIPFSSKVVVDKAEIIDTIKDIRLKLPDELKQAKWIKEERERIIGEAKKEADLITKKAEDNYLALVDEHEITKKAYEKKDEVIVEANAEYDKIIGQANQYTLDELSSLEQTLQKLHEEISSIDKQINSQIEIVENGKKVVNKKMAKS
jgi:vacuolar-type H+-ATPase subunit H